MDLIVTPLANGWVATAKDADNIIYVSHKHPRPGCALRETVNYIQVQWGAPHSVVELTLKEWK